MTNALKFGLPHSAIDKITTVLASVEQIDKAIIYGSRAMGNFRKGSDIDLCLDGPKLSQAQLRSLSLSLDDLLLPYQIDLSILADLTDPALLAHIARQGQIFYEKKS